MYEYTYESREVLKELVLHLAGANCSFSARLMPDIPEFLDAITTYRTDLTGLDLPGPLETALVKRDKRMPNMQMSDEQRHDLVLLCLCKKHDIMPFWKLDFDYSFNQLAVPEIKYTGRHWDMFDRVPYDVHQACVSPANFAGNKKWYAVDFDEVEGKESVQKAKEAIEEFSKQGYTVTSFSADLNPYTRTSDHYYDISGCDAKIRTSTRRRIIVDVNSRDMGDIMKDVEGIIRNFNERFAGKKGLELKRESLALPHKR